MARPRGRSRACVFRYTYRLPIRASRPSVRLAASPLRAAVVHTLITTRQSPARPRGVSRRASIVRARLRRRDDEKTVSNSRRVRTRAYGGDTRRASAVRVLENAIVHLEHAYVVSLLYYLLKLTVLHLYTLYET